MKYLIHILIVVGFFALFFTHPHVISGFFGAIFCFFLLLVAFVFYASYRQKKGNPIKGITIKSSFDSIPAAFVGLQGQGAGLLTESRDGRLRIRLSSASYIFILVICFLFGPGMIGLYFFRGPQFHWNAPWFAIAGILIMVGISTLLFFYYLRAMLWDTPVVEVTSEAIRFMRGVTQEAVLWQRDIKNIDIRVSKFDAGDDGTVCFIDNYTLCVTLNNGTEKGICITSNKGQIETLKSGLEQMLNLQA